MSEKAIDLVPIETNIPSFDDTQLNDGARVACHILNKMMCEPRLWKLDELHQGSGRSPDFVRRCLNTMVSESILNAAGPGWIVSDHLNTWALGARKWLRDLTTRFDRHQATKLYDMGASNG